MGRAMDEKELYRKVEEEVTEAVPPGLHKQVVVWLVANTWGFVLAKAKEGAQDAQDELRKQIKAIPGNLARGAKEVFTGIPPEEYNRRRR